jgi:hypothetical protein
MKKLILLSFFLLSSTLFVSAQQEKAAAPAQFTKAELLGFADLKAILTTINKGQDYSKYIVRNFNLSIIVSNPDGTTTVVSEMGPGGTWSEKQKAMINKYAVKGASFKLEKITMIEQGKKELVSMPVAMFSIKE